MRTYVLSDIHGEYEAFMEILDKIHFTDQDILYVMGDVLDRGPHPIKALQEMMRHPNIIPMIGNHEYMGLTCLRFLMKEITEDSLPKLDINIYEKLLNWQYNGCATTLDEFRKLDMEGRQEIIDYIEEFILYEELTVKDRDYILVHAGLGNFEPDRDLTEYDIHELVWERPDYNKAYYDDIFVVTGHTPTQLIPENNKPGYIFRKNHHIAIDCGACFFGGRLGAICLETDEEFYSSTNNRE
ncbi:MAG: metallophosphoesterase [Lachnospiraceae bacterium]|nr:metallophosphoesterase [Lachnospiraceae bacterium]